MALDTDVLVVGGGPIGLLTALTLSLNGIKCILVERNQHTTQWPKMDLTNCRSMELLQRLGIADEWRKLGVPTHYDLTILFTTGLTEMGKAHARWNLSSPDAWSKRTRGNNDGSQPSEPYQRGPQSLFEAFLREKLEGDSMVAVRYGVKFESLDERGDAVVSTLVDDKGAAYNLTSKYVVGCDGGGSRVRRTLGIATVGEPMPRSMHLIHFESQDLDVLHRQGRFWHCYLPNGSAIVAQDEGKTWTLHCPVAPETDIATLDPRAVVSEALAGFFDTPVRIKIDKILVSNKWKPGIYLSERYTSPGRRVFLAGDSAHQTVPAGGYGMNTGVGDAYDIAWKLAAVLKGYGGAPLLESYEAERRPVAARNLEQARENWDMHGTRVAMALEAGDMGAQESAAGDAVREKLRAYVETHDVANRALGIELDYRLRTSPVIVREASDKEHAWDLRSYTPSTWPGARVPSVGLSNGKRNMYDLLGRGPEFTIVDFTEDSQIANAFVEGADKLGIPIRAVHLPHETYACSVWGRDAVLVRPDDFAAWRADLREESEDLDDMAEAVLSKAVGRCS